MVDLPFPRSLPEFQKLFPDAGIDVVQPLPADGASRHGKPDQSNGLNTKDSINDR